MAKIYAAPIDAPKFDPNESVDAYQARCDAYVDQLKAIAKQHGVNDPRPEIIGEVVCFPRGDGYAQYMVFATKPLKLVHIDTWDGWHIDPITARGLRVADVVQMVQRNRNAAALFSNASAGAPA